MRTSAGVSYDGSGQAGADALGQVDALVDGARHAWRPARRRGLPGIGR